MSIVYLNGEFMPSSEAKISVFDRGFLFADSVYEVIPVYGHKLFCWDEHLQRLHNSLAGIKIDFPMSDQALTQMLKQLIVKNKAAEQFVYLHITRGADTKREHRYPASLQPTVFATTTPISNPTTLDHPGTTAITTIDYRWERCNIKATTLLANIQLDAAGLSQNAENTLLLRNGFLTEGTSSNIFIVKNNTLFTPPKSEHILPGITRGFVLALAKQYDIPYQETPISEQSLREADEIWATSSTKDIIPIVRLDNHPVGEGEPGPMWRTMLTHMHTAIDALRNET